MKILRSEMNKFEIYQEEYIFYQEKELEWNEVMTIGTIYVPEFKL